MNAVERALLDAIVADPDDDTPRLVYADYLESHGEPRGEFIHAQCRIARMAPDEDAALIARADELFREHAPSWLADLTALELPARYTLRRGFVDAMHGRFVAATARAEELVAASPLLTTFELTIDGQAERGALASPPGVAALAHARVLSIKGRHRGRTRDGRGPRARFHGLAALPFTQLQSLRLGALQTSGNDLARFLAAPALVGLAHLSLRLGMPVDEVCAVAASLELRALRTLDLAFNTIETRGLAAVVRSVAARHASSIVLDAGRLGSDAVDVLLAEELPALRELSLAHNAIGDAVHRLAGWAGAPRLEQLDVNHTGLSPAALETLRRRPGLRVITER
jgi:uncharacterized protein (TIGR02996 family)